jgi:serine protease AprX
MTIISTHKLYVKPNSMRNTFLLIIFSLVGVSFCAEPDTATKSNLAGIIRRAAAEGKLAYRLTTPEEVKVLLGQPTRQEERDEGDELVLEYPPVEFKFRRQSKISSGLFTLQFVIIKDSGFVDIGRERQIVLRNEDDLKKIDTWGGFWKASGGVSLVNLDLRGHGKLLEEMRFDSRTKWPETNKMPEGFDPVRLLEQGKNPGLGIRGLHKQGIDGRGVGIAILDQPLLKNHVEYADRILQYEEIGVDEDEPPQMHGPPIVSIAVGKNCGVAPKAFIFYYAMPSTVPGDNAIFCDIIDKIIEHNEDASALERIRVVNISAGISSEIPNFIRWQDTLKKAHQLGILVVTTTSPYLRYGRLNHIPGGDPDDPNNYHNYGTGKSHSFMIPVGNKTTASHFGPQVYTYWAGRCGGSWAAPYMVGLAALAFQVNPEIKPQTIAEQLAKTSTHTKAGPIVNPRGFIESIKDLSIVVAPN